MSATRRSRPASVLLVLFAAGGCLGLAWWQWSRFESSAGDFQNLGYALQWPLFAGFCVYAYRSYVRYEQEAPPHHRPGDITEIPPGVLPERPTPPPETADATLREYNAYLRQLADADASTDTDRNRTA